MRDVKVKQKKQKCMHGCLSEIELNGLFARQYQAYLNQVQSDINEKTERQRGKQFHRQTGGQIDQTDSQKDRRTLRHNLKLNGCTEKQSN